MNSLIRISASALFVVAMTGVSALCAESDESIEHWQSLEAIRSAAQTHVSESMTQVRGSTRIVAASLDSRLKLPVCPTPLNTETPWSVTRGNRVTVRVSCDTENQWRVHVPVEVSVFGSVVTSARALARGTILSPGDLSVSEQPLGPLGHGYFADPANVVGQRLKRPLAPGSVVTPAQLETPAVIRRGQNVTIVANTGGIAVKMNGTAEENGAIGQVIDIRNTSSGRRVQGVVRSSRAVEILLR